jgi:hypothetical protein
VPHIDGATVTSAGPGILRGERKLKIKVSFEVEGIKFSCPTFIVEETTPQAIAALAPKIAEYIEGAKKRVAGDRASQTTLQKADSL